ncbi:J domain-containing protein [Thiomonas sp.]
MIEAYPLYWPEGWPRVESRTYSRFSAGFAVARDGLMEEIRRLGGTSPVLSTNIPLRRDGLPQASAKRPADPGVAVYFAYQGRPMCFACDQYLSVQENIRAIAKTIEALRGIARWGASDLLDRAFRGFEALPAPQAARDWREVLGHPENLGAAKRRYKEMAQRHHPDRGGDRAAWDELQEAWDAAQAAYGGNTG